MYGLIYKFSFKSAHWKPFCTTGSTWISIIRFGWNYIYMWTVKQYDIFKVVNTLVKSVYCGTEWGKRWHCKLEGNGFDSRGVIGILHWLKLSGCTVAQGLTQPLQEMSTKGYLLGGKGVRYVGLTSLPPACAESVEILGAQGPAALRAPPESCCMCSETTLYEGMQDIN